MTYRVKWFLKSTKAKYSGEFNSLCFSTTWLITSKLDLYLSTNTLSLLIFSILTYAFNGDFGEKDTRPKCISFTLHFKRRLRLIDILAT